MLVGIWAIPHRGYRATPTATGGKAGPFRIEAIGRRRQPAGGTGAARDQGAGVGELLVMAWAAWRVGSLTGRPRTVRPVRSAAWWSRAAIASACISRSVRA